MTAMAVLSLVLAAAWAVTAGSGLRRRGARDPLVLWSALVAAGHLLAGFYAPGAPLVLLTWLGFGLGYPQGLLITPARRILLGLGGLGFGAWAVGLGRGPGQPDVMWLVTAALAVTGVSTAAIALRCRRATPRDRAAVQWLAAATVLVIAVDAVLLALHVMAGSPEVLRPWLVAPLLLVPASVLAGSVVTRYRMAGSALIEAIVVAGLACLVSAVYLVVVVGLGRTPQGAERGILVSSLVAAVVVAALAQPVRFRLVELGSGLVSRQEISAEEVVSTFGARMSRAVPMDELMLQAAESLRATIAGAGAEIWVGADGVLSRSVTVPARPVTRLVLGERERVVVGRARIGGQSWASVWLPEIAGERAGDPDVVDLRVAPVAHLGDLLGLIVVRRHVDAPAYTDDDDRRLVELARQLGLALHNVRLDSALQASLEELELRNEQLQASRLRIVTASDQSRQAIERNLHDGAQQHLVALAVKLGLAEALVEEDPEMVTELLRELRSDVQTTIRELRELAHGIYPPLLRDRGLAEALRTAANRSPLACTVDVDLPRRFAQAAETATYFCCLEAMQNAGKHAGPQAELTVRVDVGGSDGQEPGGGYLRFSVTDDGAGFDASAAAGHGFVNMYDRLGAIGGDLRVDSEPGRGTTIRGRIPLSAAELEPGPEPRPEPRPDLHPDLHPDPQPEARPASRPADAAMDGKLAR